jgi:CRISPR-associated protein Csx14
LLELAAYLWPGSEGWFTVQLGDSLFHVVTHGGDNDPLQKIVGALCDSEDLVALADDHAHQAQADRKPIVLVPFGGLRLDWWLYSYRGADKSELKVWAGQQTPERNLKALRAAWRSINARSPDQVASRKMFSHRWPMTGRFGFDPSASWEALDVGFSPDEQQIGSLTSPSTEILAAIGLQRCRPLHVERRSFSYFAWADPLEIAVAPAGLMGIGRTLSAHTFPIIMRNSQYGSFGWAKPREDKQ